MTLRELSLSWENASPRVDVAVRSWMDNQSPVIKVWFAIMAVNFLLVLSLI